MFGDEFVARVPALGEQFESRLLEEMPALVPGRPAGAGHADADLIEHETTLFAKAVQQEFSAKMQEHDRDEDQRQRPGHDRRYALDGNKLKNLGWKSPIDFDTSMTHTIKWSLDNPHWLS